MEWQPIETAPKDGTAVLFFHRNLSWKTSDGSASKMSPLRDYVERCSVGFYEDGAFFQQGTGHEIFEPWKEPEHLPTHWMPLPEPPND